ncbi:erythrocyte membrane protein 1, PfEMP1, putative [Plasmodium reichenowi]|uniref:Erythrocyte membrane protein 1, PfEMP1, putative n=1 Tax=Plasmodium reichenowi TaxID=5854 RepID=A0A2P9DSU1_PLARE|nr:erythrocyte membrane protein 1, PfEMP1, putative [Plasmodium reichenowi]
MVPQSSGTKSAKERLDEIGEKTYKKLKDGAVDYKPYLKGDLREVHFTKGEKTHVTDACHLDHKFETNVSWGESDPCAYRSPVRFSDEGRSQCSTNRISGNDNDSGACASYRKIQLCDYNLEKITDTYTTTTHNLLVDVLLAAKYEGQMIAKKLQEYDKDNYESRICIELARSFADIGDIIRGKDLYRGNKRQNANQREKEKLQQNLKEIFKKIYDNLMKELEEDSTKKAEAQKRYKADENYFQLREDWWEANRAKVWQAITCNAGGGKYFRNTCFGGGLAENSCRCATDQVPTYFDYVPQFLRWFEEWAEDFCRKKKKKLQKLEKVCRGNDQNGDPRYCSRNGYDCEETIYRIRKLVIGKGCINCLYACNPYVEWIDNKKNEFEKQKNKSESEIYKSKNRSQSSSSSVNDIYYEKFYEEFKTEYATMNAFLESLNKEKQCKNIEEKHKESKVDFTNINDKNNDNKTFSHSQYCQVCPDCGVEYKGSKWESKPEDEECSSELNYNPSGNVERTNINVLYSGETNEEIKEKLTEFCNKYGKDHSQDEQWQCYYKNSEENMCKMTNSVANDNEHAKIMDFYDFVKFWVGHMLKDSIYWRTEKLKGCLQNGKKIRCKNGCNTKCDCFQKWIKKKEQEWAEVKGQYGKQNDFKGADPYMTLEEVLKLEFLKDNSEDHDENAKETVHIQKMFERKATEGRALGGTKNKTTIDFLIEEELQEAEECLGTHTKEKCPEDTTGGLGRTIIRPRSKEGEPDEDDDDENADEEPTPQLHDNPCATPSGGESGHQKYPAVAQTVAHTMKVAAHKKMKDNSGDSGGKSVLEADASKGEYYGNGKVSGGELGKGKICNIDESKHSNRNINNAQHVCNNKAQDRLKIGKGWKNMDTQDTTYAEVVLPQRRQHMCTSNLEFLQTDDVPFSGPDAKLINDSFLGDVLLAAKYEVQNIKKLYKGKNENIILTEPKHQTTVCKAMKSSFADLGDIIRGRDMWDKNSGEEKTQKNLVKIFKKIKDNLPNDTIKDKYKGDTDGKHTQLRADWWEANRDEVWDAMKCSLKSDDNIPCDNHTPLDDYIPQRLRWMSEWAEWFCKAQSQEYDKLLQKCGICMSGTCTKDSGKDCTDCTTACGEYWGKIKKWQPQWKKMEQKYEELYKEATGSGGKGSGGNTNDKDKDVVKFLKQLLPRNNIVALNRAKRAADSNPTGAPTTTPNTPYATAAGYVYQELLNPGCETQILFCNTKGKPDKYAFRHQPNDQDKACNCNKPKTASELGRSENTQDEPPARPPPPPPEAPQEPTQDNVEVCPIVEQLFQNPSKFSDACTLKYGPKAPSSWKCIPTNKTGTNTNSDVGGDRSSRPTREAPRDPSGKTSSDSGSICVPPRRRKLYVGKIKEWATNYTTGNTQEGETSQDGNGSQVGVTEKPDGSEGKGGTTEASSPVTVSQPLSSPSDPRDGLLQAFVESAAIETFFLWDRYKKIKQKELDEKRRREGLNPELLLPLVSSTPVAVPGQLQQQLQGRPQLPVNGEESGGSNWTGGRGLSHLGGDRTGETSSETGLQPTQLTAQSLGLPPPAGLINGRSRSLLQDGSEHGYNPYSDDSDSSDDNSPHNQLQNGDIPLPFLRQMFYTIADYRDILVGNVPHGIDKVTVSGTEKEKQDGEKSVKDESSKLTMKEISERIKKAIENSGNNPSPPRDTDGSSSGSSPSPSAKQTPQNSVTTPSSWWNNHAPQIWKAMICALTYEDKSETSPMTTQGDGNTPKITQDDDLKQAFFGEKPTNPDNKSTPSTNNGTFHKEYKYETVKLEQNSDIQPMTNDTITTPTLKNFVKIPPYFRYLHEWGNDFCKKRKEKLKQIDKDCKVDKGDEKCDGDGFQCKKESPKTDGIIRTSDCPSCANSCSSYRRWIEKKRTEYQKQQNAYQEQKKGAESNNVNINDNDFVRKLSSDYNSIESFLPKLGSCKKDNAESNIPFNDESKTFGQANNCAPCPVFGVTCDRGDCNSGRTKGECKNKTITPGDIENNKVPNGNVVMLVSDNLKTNFDDLLDCQNARIFKGIRKDEWKCGKVCGVDVCGLKKKNNKNGIDEKQIILINALVRRWVENFLEDYNRIKDKISHCIKNSKEDKCTSDCPNKCNCVEKWIEKKREEWKNIKELYQKQYENNHELDYPVTTFLEEFKVRPEFQKAIKPCKSLEQFKNSCGLNGTENSPNGKDYDLVLCLIEKLKKKTESCPTPDSDETKQTCEKPSQSGVHLPHVGDVDDYEEENEEENDKKVKAPGFCDIDEETTKEDDGGCEEPKKEVQKEESEDGEKKEDKDKADVAPPPETASTEDGSVGPTTENGGGEQTPVLKPEEEAPNPQEEQTPASDEKKRSQPTQPRRNRRQIVEKSPLPEILTASAFPWTVGKYKNIEKYLLKRSKQTDNKEKQNMKNIVAKKIKK